jgi:RHS repeat-associated protein
MADVPESVSVNGMHRIHARTHHRIVGSGVYYLHQDALGSTRLVTTTLVTVKFSSDYVPYGPNYAVSGREVFMYTGKPSDTTTGLYYFGARYYDPSIGRFITEDSYNGSKYAPLSQNRYIYALDNPMKYVDENGHDPMNWWSWFLGSYITKPDFWFDLTNAIMDAIDIIFPNLGFWKDTLLTAFNKYVLFAGGGVWVGYELAQYIQSDDIRGMITAIGSLTTNVLSYWWHHILNGWQQWAVTIETAGYELGDAFSGGSIQALMDIGNSVLLTYDAFTLVFNTQAAWNQCVQTSECA